MCDASLLSHFTLEGVDVRPGGRNPVGVERLEEHLPLLGLPRPAGTGRRGSLGGTGGVAQSAEKDGGSENGHRHRQVDYEGHDHGGMA